MPVDGAGVAGVVEAVLGARGAVAVEYDLEVGGAGPGEGVVEVCSGAREVRGVGIVEGPIAYRNTDAVLWMMS